MLFISLFNALIKKMMNLMSAQALSTSLVQQESQAVNLRKAYTAINTSNTSLQQKEGHQ